MDREPTIGLSFDVEEHHRIEAAAHLRCAPELAAAYTDRMDASTRWLLDFLGERRLKATFYVLGQIGKSHPHLIRRMADEGHEVANHSWAHRPVWKHNPAAFREDVRVSKETLEQAAGTAVIGFRAPTFSVLRAVPWAIDVLVELGFRYDSSIFPVRHDRYGVYGAPRIPFMVRGRQHEILEMPPLTLHAAGHDVPVAGGGYFRLFPLWLIRRGLSQMARLAQPAVMYFHPWEFDPDQPRLPLGRVSSFRTYVGIRSNRDKLARLLGRYHCCRIVDLVDQLEPTQRALPKFDLAAA
jgi:polysaccharide deacetylase family protein (PEP-CTERM system associated)